MTEVLPCVFCGSDKLEIVSRNTRDDGVRCKCCDSYGPKGLKNTDEPIERWNIRHSPDFTAAYTQFAQSLVAERELNAHLRNLCRALITEQKHGHSVARLDDLLKQIDAACRGESEIDNILDAIDSISIDGLVGGKIERIKTVRRLTSWSLEQAKIFIEQRYSENGYGARR